MYKIVLVEDSLAVRERLQRLLAEIGGFTIIGEYDSAPVVIAAIDREVPDVAVLDIRLRIGNGMDVLRHIRARALKTRVIVFSQYDDPDYREQFRAAGADFFFAKTNETAHLQQTLKQMVTPG